MTCGLHLELRFFGLAFYLITEKIVFCVSYTEREREREREGSVSIRFALYILEYINEKKSM